MDLKNEFVNVDTETFSATVPSIGMLSPMLLIRIMVEKDSATQFRLSVMEFRKNLTDEKRIEFDSLTINDWVEIMTAWLNASGAENAQKEKKAKKRWTWWWPFPKDNK